MGRRDTATETVNQELLGEIQYITHALKAAQAREAQLIGLVNDGATVVGLENEIARLTREVTKLEIARDKQLETTKRERREIEHLVGLERKRSEAETALALREAKIGVREEAFAKDLNRFQEQMDFNNAQFNNQVRYLQEIVGKVLAHLPKVELGYAVEE